MSTTAIHRPELLKFSPNGIKTHRKFWRINASWRMAVHSNFTHTGKMKELSLNLPAPPIPQVESLRPSDLQFHRLQPSGEDLNQRSKLEFGNFVAQDAMLDEEFWTAACLWAESHWEDRSNERYVDNYTRKYAEQEFNAIKRRCKENQGQKCTCIVTVKKQERNVKRTTLKSVVGTLDLSIGYLLYGENFPGGIASNMLHFAVESARLNGVEQVYMHVHRNNRPAQELYQKMGFEMVEMASSQLLEGQTSLLCLKT